MAYKCICGTYVFKFLELCRQCRGEHGYYSDWPEWVRWDYFDLNLGGDYEYGELDELGRPGSVKAAPLGKPGDKDTGAEIPQVTYYGFVQRVCPVCQKQIKAKERLCLQCLRKYGSDEAKWDQWLIAQVHDDQKAIDDARGHREYSLDDDRPASRQAINNERRKAGGSVGGRTYAQFNPDEVSQDVLDWGDSLAGPEPKGSPAKEIKGDKLGHKYNEQAWQGSDTQAREFGDFSERDGLDDDIDNTARIDQELEKSDYTRQIVILLYGAGHKQWEIAELLGIDQQRVSDILKKRPNVNI